MKEQSNAALNSVAIIGMSGRLPGAENVEAFWSNLERGVGAISSFSREELEHCQAAANPANAANYVRARSILENVDLFDAAFFGIYPKQAEVMDPQHRVFLECAWEALECAGYDPGSFPGLIGLYAGLSLNTYLLYNISSKAGFAPSFAAAYPGGDYDTLFGNDKDFLTTRVAHKLNLRGPCVTVQTACSTSLVAVVQAYYSLLTYQCDMALAGGISITFPQRRDYLYQPDGMVSRDGTCRTFDAEASGTVFGSGAGIVVLKRLEDAIEAGDHIRAVVLGGAMNNDGSARAGYAAPGVDGQAEVIAMAQSTAGINPESISYVEAHGTGTPLGDPIEVAALTQAFRRSTDKTGFCAIGSAKTHVGHLDMAAGVTGLIKTVLQFEHEKIPALLNFKSPNPRIDFAQSPFFPVRDVLEWKRKEIPRRAGVSAFGVGGTNAHVIVEEAPQSESPSRSRTAQLLLLSAKTPNALEAMTRNLAEHLEQNPTVSLADVAFTLQCGRRGFAHRRMVVASDVADAEVKLGALEPKFVSTAQVRDSQLDVVFLFPGQGTQYVNMGRGLYETEATFRTEVDRCATILQSHLGLDIRDVLYPSTEKRSEGEKLINETWLAQPAIFVIEYSLAKLWISWGIKPTVVVGHSLGEYVCAVLAGTFTLEDALALVALRAKLMHNLPGGAMLVVRLSAEEATTLLPNDLSIAASNAANLCTVSGPIGQIEEFQKELEARKIACRRLATSHAFHSAMMEPILPKFISAVAATPRQSPTLRWISTCTAEWMTAAEVADPSYWGRQLRQPVRFSAALDLAFSSANGVLLEVGPDQSLTQLARQRPDQKQAPAIMASLAATRDPGRDAASILLALGRLWLSGLQPDWIQFYANERRRRVPLPTYPFERKRFWVEPIAVNTNGIQSGNDVKQTASAADRNGVASESERADSERTKMVMGTTSSKGIGERVANLASQVRATIKELSGTEVASDSVTLAELGFDSLFLTQASQALQTRFGVKVTFRQLLEELSTVSALANFLDRELPADHGHISPTTNAIDQAAGALMPAPTQAGSPVLEQLLAQQIQLMQLVLGQKNGQPNSAPARASTPVAPPQAIRWPRGTRPSSATHQPNEFKRFGPYKPIEKGERGGLTARQQKALDELMSRYTQRTAASKKYTQENRSHFADPRAVSGFKQNWKEIVYPIVSTRSKGSKIWDLDDNEYVDITMGFGAYFFGHSPDWLVEAVQKQLAAGMEIGPQSAIAGDVAKLICEFTGMERATFCNTGSEAVMAALRLARMVTGRRRVVYFSGDYHGMFEEVLVRSSWVNGEYRAQPIAPGMPSNMVENILVLEYGAAESIEIIKNYAGEIAAVMVEPVQSRQPGLQPRAFLHELRSLADQNGFALIFDEVVTGFRCHPGGAQAYFGVQADLATYGKVVGGGMPLGILAGKSKYMDGLDGGIWQYGDESFPEAGVTFFAGTFVRHPLAMAAALAVLQRLKEQGSGLQLRLTERVSRLCRTLNTFFALKQVPLRLSCFSAFAMIEHAHELKYATLLWYYLRLKGIHVWEGRPCFFTLAHTNEDFDRVIRAFKESVEEMQAGGWLPESPSAAEPPGQIEAAQVEYPREDYAPTTEAQREVFLSVQMGPEANCSYNEANMIELRGTLDMPALERALLHLIERHPALRSTFTPDGNRQLFHETMPALKIVGEDLSGLNEFAQQQHFEELCKRETETPFDLVHGPLIRMKLVKRGLKHHTLVITAHHLVCDGWSYAVLVSELAGTYNARVNGGVPMLPPPLSFADYARHLENDRSSQTVKASEEYWLDMFKSGAPTLELPTTRPRPAIKTFSGGMKSLRIDEQRFAQLKKIAPQLGGTLFSTLLAAFGALLHRLTGQDDLVIGIPAAGQTMVGCNELVGHCLNFLPLRIAVGRQETFSELAKGVKQRVLDAYDRQNCTFGTLIPKLKLPLDTSRLPLVSVMFNIDKSGFDAVRFEGLDFEFRTNPKQFVNFELFFNLVQGDKSLEVECEYNTDLFDGATIESWLEAYDAMIEGLITAPATRIGQLPFVGTKGRQQIANEWNNTQRDYPRNLRIHELIAEQAQETPDRIAVRCQGEALTYAALDQEANRLASVLVARGARQGVNVALCVDRSVRMVVGLLGILKSGAAYVPLDPTFPMERLAFMIQDSGAAFIVTQKSVADRVPPTSAEHILLDNLSAAGSKTMCSPGSSEDLAYIIYTSGSTGKPKGVSVSHRSVVSFLQSMRREPGIVADDILLSVTTVSFDIAGLEIYLPLTTGATVVVANRDTLSDGNLLRQEIESCGATIMQATPATWRLLLEAGWTGSSKLKILIGGEAVPLDLVNRLAPKCGSIWNMYGPTETTIWSTICRLRPGEDIVSIGKPIDNTQVYVVDQFMELLPPGIPGELLIGGDGVASGYWNQPELTAEKFIPNRFSSEPGCRLYRTGDLARWLPTGALECLGRADNQVKIRGFRVELGEIEAALAKHPAVKQTVVVARDGASGRKELVAYLIPTAFPGPPPAQLRAHLAGELPEYMIPTIYSCLESFPTTANGKIARNSLPEPYQNGVPVAKSLITPRTADEQALSEIWREVLRRNEIGMEDDIFDLGADSILIFQITTRANRVGFPLTPALVFRHRTIASLVTAIGKGNGLVTPPRSSSSSIHKVDRAAYRIPA